jgi:dTDP-3,4-didehydro-2,6-dideoxy-alpha-D-glucose 3-reductase
MKMTKLRVGILGCADIAVRVLGPTFQAHPLYELVYFAGRDINKTNVVANKFGCKALPSYQALIDRDDVDLIYIPLPNSLHKEWAIKSLLSGKHVLCEKSLGCSYNEVKEMVEASRSAGKLLVENFQFRFHSQHQIIKKLLAEGELGEIRCFRSSFGFPPFNSETNIRYNSSLGGGALLDAGAYTIKATKFIMGDNFEVEAANLNISDKLNVDICGGIYMQNNKGQFAELSFGFDNFYQCNYEIWGSKGKLTAMRAFTAHPDFFPTILIEKQSYKEEKVLSPDNHFINMLTHISECIQSDSIEPENQQNLVQAYNIEQVKILSVKYNF